ncbi:hypothetical protein SEA_ROSCOE_87 [Mycobacterium phage Roscoe]|uniref:Uncharacterized protein n=6 Tax=Pegunavirus TaxID=1623295 RepID=A0A899IQD3_9CAUD|nr:hypothetical protein M046_gp84 [Mycobacterium phage Newman]AGC33947.1 hypothetical protein PIGLET_0087 [Mycobacterium phage Piglet]ASZ73448.1 hypothetical protein SEA_LULUMAE_83 [Mycobacterium phage Lulumae]ATN89327.1 hypothetical protein SEA_HORCHATA_83 [Mycobacterium phage Horchata]ATN91022.1 hypothetical protein SEA_MIKOTA_83 [Mycobacterium phage Mikota]ATN91593.1 hypothetical protein SEA_PHUNKY_85 [Mycobacterium phage Phunky]ATN91831.1 hypothetical protein SEA_SHEILA_82 [Mycobacterium 
MAPWCDDRARESPQGPAQAGPSGRAQADPQRGSSVLPELPDLAPTDRHENHQGRCPNLYRVPRQLTEGDRMSCFAVGHRVIVRPENGYDDPVSAEFGPMAGHYGKVVEIDPAPHDSATLITVEIVGRVDGPVSPAICVDRVDPQWVFYPHELDHID